MSIAIKFERVSKQYRLGEVGTGTLSHDLHRAWAKFRGKPDPFGKVGTVNDRTVAANKGGKAKKGVEDDYVWALKDINLEVEKGEILGIIGRNGAGKSTLLKLLSRVTAPTSGCIKTRGRLASLLEVGTGFHPELTGRENVFLNGAIMGMTRPEINKHLDEIIEFSGCAKYIDTPVKRYSSGMTVRLGFAVAASLRCDTLIVDEVLAVGDAEFQKNCIAKMNDVSRSDGKTILLVSHNMATIAALCNKAVLMQNGAIGEVGNAKDVVTDYIAVNSSELEGRITWVDGDAPGTAEASLRMVRVVVDGKSTSSVRLNEEFEIEAEFVVSRPGARVNVSFHLNDSHGGCIFATVNMASAMLNQCQYSSEGLEPGRYLAKCIIPAFFLNSESYFISAFLVAEGVSLIAQAPNCITFTAHDTGEMRKEYLGPWIGTIRPKFAWSVEPVEASAI